MSHTRELTERYRLEKILKSSRSGTVLKATDTADGRPVVIKLIPLGTPGTLSTPADGEARQARFLRLVTALRQQVHPSLPRALDAGFTPDGEAFLVLERLEGRSLAEWSGAPPGRVLALLEQAAAALDALATRGLAHANLAPENVFVIPSSQGERAKLLGLGTAIFRPSPGAVPPEIARFQPPEGDAAGWRGDLWAFATTTAAVLGIQEPPPGSPEPAITLPLGLTFELEDADALRLTLERCLRPDPAARPASWQQVRDAIGLALGHTFAVVRPVGAEAPQPAAPPTPPAPATPATSATATPVPVAPAPALSVQPRPVSAAPAIEPKPADIADSSSELLTPITDELLDRLARPKPKPAPPPPATAAAAGAAPAPGGRRRPTLLLLSAGVALVLAAGAAWWLVGRSAAPPPAVFPAARPERPSVPASERLATARELVAQGLDDRARELLAGLTPTDQATLGPADCALYTALQETLAGATLDRLATDLPAGLAGGSLAALLPLVHTVRERGATVAGLYAGAAEDFATASRLVELYDAAEAAGGDHARVLAQFAALRELFPRQRDAFELRDRAAEAIADEAEAIARRGDYDAAAARLAIVAGAWPDRPGLAERLRALRGFAAAEPAQLALLEKLPQYERRRKPDEALAALHGVEPIPHLEARFAAARTRLEAQLAQLDRNPPVVELRDEGALQYDRGTYVNLSFRVKDDYKVKDVDVMARRQGGRAQALDYERDRFGYTIEIPPSFHQNGTIEVFITATDLSGHEGRLGSRDQPLRITRAGGFERLLRN